MLEVSEYQMAMQDLAEEYERVYGYKLIDDLVFYTRARKELMKELGKEPEPEPEQSTALDTAAGIREARRLKAETWELAKEWKEK